MQERFKAFTVLIAKINRNIRRIKTEEMVEFGLKSPHVSCLYYLYTEGPLTPKELCVFCDEDKGALSRSVEFLENKGFIASDNSSVKRYKTPIRLTETGLELGKIIHDKIDGVLSVSSEGLTEEERNVMYKCLAQISDNLQTISSLKSKN